VKVSFERRKVAKVFVTHVQDFFRKSLSKATVERKLSSVSLPSAVGRVCQTSKKKFFVVRAETSSGPARLEYYDSEKKFHSGGLARRCILLKNCFSINAKSDSTRHRHMIVLYTEDDCFGIACGSETEQQEWLNTMVQLRCQSLNSSSRSTAAYSK